MSHSDLKHEDLKDISSTLAWLYGHNNDRDITTAMMGFLFKCRKQRDSFCFDFSVCIARAMVKQLSEFQQFQWFKFSSVLVHLLLHQNEAFFGQYMRLATCDESGNKMLVSAWTPLLLASFDTYQFSDFFLTLVLRDFGSIPNEPLAHFSQVQMN